MRFVIEGGASFYRFMESGKPVCGLIKAADFDESTATKVCEQLRTFRGDVEWSPLRVVTTGELLAKLTTQKAIADALDCHASTVCGWIRDGLDVPAKYLRAANSVLGAPPGSIRE